MKGGLSDAKLATLADRVFLQVVLNSRGLLYLANNVLILRWNMILYIHKCCRCFLLDPFLLTRCQDRFWLRQKVVFMILINSRMIHGTESRRVQILKRIGGCGSADHNAPSRNLLKTREPAIFSSYQKYLKLASVYRMIVDLGMWNTSCLPRKQFALHQGWFNRRVQTQTISKSAVEIKPELPCSKRRSTDQCLQMILGNMLWDSVFGMIDSLILTWYFLSCLSSITNPTLQFFTVWGVKNRFFVARNWKDWLDSTPPKESWCGLQLHHLRGGAFGLRLQVQFSLAAGERLVTRWSDELRC